MCDMTLWPLHRLVLLACVASTARGQTQQITLNGCLCKQSWTDPATAITCSEYCCREKEDHDKFCMVEDPACEEASWGRCQTGGSQGWHEDEGDDGDEDCFDQEGWRDFDGDGCSAYVRNQWCTAAGKVGPGWHEEWGDLHEFDANGYNVFQACCGCGGGSKVAENPNAQRFTFAGCRCQKNWEDQGMSCGQSCCNPDEDPAGLWCLVEDETCESSFWGYCRREDGTQSGAAVASPSGDKHGHCTDVKDWHDLDAETCQGYGSHAYCTEVGGYGLGWNLDWGAFEEFVDEGVLPADEACCVCGGGTRSDKSEPGQGTETVDPDAKVHTTLLGCECMKEWQMDGIGPCKNYCCNPDNDKVGTWCMVSNPSCEDSDWGYCEKSGLGFLETAPRGPLQDAAHCQDVATWQDRDGDSCALYSLSLWCTSGGEAGPGWHEEWGTVPDGAFTACCACGGGTIFDEDSEAEQETTSESVIKAVENLVSEVPEHMWWVASGPCTMDDHGCISSGNWPQKYDSHEQCQIGVDVDKAKPIHVKSFETESNYDVLKINGELYSGSRAPNGIIPETTIFWGSDAKDEKKGWKMCPRGEVAQRKPGVMVLKLVGIAVLVIFCSCCGAIGGLWLHTYRNMPHGDGLGAGPTKIGKYAVQEDS